MKKILLICLFLLSWIFFVACGKKEVVDDTVNIESTEITSCQKAINRYLDWSDEKWKWDSIKEWDNIVVDYIWRLEDGTVFDTTIKSIAEACDIYNENIDYTHWYEFSVWMNQKLKWFDEWVIWMKVWQTKTVQFWPEKWYWQRREDYVMTYSAEEVWDLSKFTQGQRVYLWIWAAALITEVTDKSITLDLNHELAGKDLIFDITIKSIN